MKVWFFSRRLIVAMCISALAVFAIAPEAFAAEPDYTDKYYSFNLTSKGSTSGTAWRAKGSNSSVYIYISTKMGKTCRGFVDGATSGKGAGKKDCTIGTVFLANTGHWRIRNTVKESKKTHARITSWAQIGSGRVTGQWSPDCAGSYNPLN